MSQGLFARARYQLLLFWGLYSQSRKQDSRNYKEEGQNSGGCRRACSRLPLNFPACESKVKQATKMLLRTTPPNQRLSLGAHTVSNSVSMSPMRTERPNAANATPHATSHLSRPKSPNRRKSSVSAACDQHTGLWISCIATKGESGTAGLNSCSCSPCSSPC